MIYAVSLSFYTWLVQLYASMDVRIFFHVASPVV